MPGTGDETVGFEFEPTAEVRHECLRDRTNQGAERPPFVGPRGGRDPAAEVSGQIRLATQEPRYAAFALRGRVAERVMVMRLCFR
jgi:hypothetical protein